MRRLSLSTTRGKLILKSIQNVSLISVVSLPSYVSNVVINHHYLSVLFTTLSIILSLLNPLFGPSLISLGIISVIISVSKPIPS